MARTPFRTEIDFVNWLQVLATQVRGREKLRALREHGVSLGIGDDAALVAVKKGYDLILTTDMTVEDVHFNRGLHPPEAVGHRALARSLSDVGAMGGVPRYILVSLAISNEIRRDWISRFYRGLLALGHRFGARLVGGDTALVPDRVFIDVLVAGEVPKGKALRRSGARPGDQIFVSGRLGLSALGLRLLRSRRGGSRLPTRGLAGEALRAHLYPEPQCLLGRFISERRLASSLMDLSDGLSTDLARLCDASGVGARLWAAKIPAPDLPEPADSLKLALHGGEDYQLLFTVPPRKVSRLPLKFRGKPLFHVGEIEPSHAISLVTPAGKIETLEPAGWDYFRKKTD